MTEDTIDQLCEKCGATFSAFLHQMADQNERVVCPNCRAGDDCQSARAENNKALRPASKPS
jgi:hypothetical protein